MQFSADFVALGMHQADVLRAEREIGRRLSADERRSAGTAVSTGPASYPSPRADRRSPQLALR